MAHEIDMSNGKANMAYVGAAPWHGLGQLLTPDASFDVWAEEAGMNFTIKSEEAYFIPKKAKVTIPNKQVLYRGDTNAYLSVVSSSYKVVQPEEILGFFKDLSDAHGFTLETAGCLFGGSKYWALAKTPYEFKLPGNDIIKANLLLATACDGTMSTVARYVNTRVVCNNTIEMAMGEKSNSIKVSHRQVFDDKRVKSELGLLDTTWADYSDKIDRLTKRSITSQEAVDYLIKVIGDPTKPVEKQPNAKMIAKVYDLYDGQGIGSHLESAEHTMWGILNAVTEYVDHHRGTKLDDLTQSRRLDEAWFYSGATMKTKAFDKAVAFVD